MLSDPSVEFIKKICDLYAVPYDDRDEHNREENTKHLSLRKFQQLVELVEGIHLSTSKLQKILITGGYWSTEVSRKVYDLYGKYIDLRGEDGMNSDEAIRKVAEDLGISTSMVWTVLPYQKAVYDLEERSINAVMCERWRPCEIFSVNVGLP